MQALAAGHRGLRVLQAAKCAVAMEDLDMPWSPSSTGPVLGSFQPQLHQTCALANANVALEMLGGFSPPPF